MTRGILWALLKNPPTVERIHLNGKPHHITLQYDVELDGCLEWLDRRFVASTRENCWNDRVQALRVELPDWVVCQENPHITVSWADGAEPVESNDMLRDGDFLCQPYHDLLVAEIDFEPFAEPNSLLNGLKRWSRLEPERCQYSGQMFDVWLDDSWRSVWALRVSDQISRSGIAVIHYAVLDAIAAQNFRGQLENSADRWHASIMAAEGTRYCTAQDKEPAIALLQAYVSWLEQSKEVAA